MRALTISREKVKCEFYKIAFILFTFLSFTTIGIGQTKADSLFSHFDGKNVSLLRQIEYYQTQKVLLDNIKKLETRYPGGKFSVERSEDRIV